MISFLYVRPSVGYLLGHCPRRVMSVRSTMSSRLATTTPLPLPPSPLRLRLRPLPTSSITCRSRRLAIKVLKASALRVQGFAAILKVRGVGKGRRVNPLLCNHGYEGSLEVRRHHEMISDRTVDGRQLEKDEWPTSLAELCSNGCWGEGVEKQNCCGKAETGGQQNLHLIQKIG